MRIEYDEVPEQRWITLLALNLRFTKAERTAIREAQTTDEDVSDLMYLFQVAKYIDLDRTETIGGLQLLEAKGLLGAGRAGEVLSAPVQPQERA